MKKLKKTMMLFAVAAAVTMTAGIATACGEEEPDVPQTITNGDFETKVSEKNPAWSGWKKSGMAFNPAGIVSADTIGADGADPSVVVGKAGKQWYTGVSSAAMSGSLTSAAFKLTGTGKIGFLFGAGKDAEKCYVEFYEDGSTTPLSFKLDGGTQEVTKFSNTDFDGVFVSDHMIRHVADLSAHLNKTITIKVTDNATSSDYGYVNLDDFRVYTTDAQVTAALKERTDKLGELTANNPNGSFVADPTDAQYKNQPVNGDFEDGLNGWKIILDSKYTGRSYLPSSVKKVDPTAEGGYTYWGEKRAVYGHGTYFLCGEAGDPTSGEIRSSNFILGGEGYISLMLGAGSVGTNNYVALCDAATGEEISYTYKDSAGNDAETTRITNRGFKDPDTAGMLLRTYVKYNYENMATKKVYLKIVDCGKSNFGFLNVDDIRCSLTLNEVKELEKEQFTAACAQTYNATAKYDDLKTLKEYYMNYADYPTPLPATTMTQKIASKVQTATASFDLTTYLSEAKASYENAEVDAEFAITSVKHGETETTEGFNTFDLSEEGVYFVTYTATYENMTATETFALVVGKGETSNHVQNGGFESGDLTGWTILTDGMTGGVINATTYWNEQLSYNQAGNYHLNGFKENTGIEEPENWAVRSSVFTLGGSGWISVRMGGRAAAVKVYLANGRLIGEYAQKLPIDASDFPNTALGHWADMHTHAINLSEYVGEKLYLELCDVAVSGSWANAFFDEVVTYYETAPDLTTLKDTYPNSTNMDPATVEMEWQQPENTATGIIFGTKAENQFVAISTGTPETVDVTKMIEGVTAYIGKTDATVAVTKIKFGETETTTGFNAFVISEVGSYVVTYTATVGNQKAEETFTINAYDSRYEVQNGGFETGDLTGWTIQTNGMTGGVISATTYWGEQLSYNQAGNYHLNGFKENTGIEEKDTWSVKSSVFTLGGSGWITVRMGGRAAAVKVYKEDGTQIGEYHQQLPINPPDTFPNTANGHWADMHTYAIDLSEHIGEKLYLELCDIAVEGDWANAFFDEVKTYYATAPDVATMKDVYANSVNQTPATVEFPWQLAVNVYTASANEE